MIRLVAGGRRWPPIYLASALLASVLTYAMRPMVSYQAIEIGVSPGWIGIIAATFSVLPIFLAIPIGRLTDLVGERPLLISGAVTYLVSCAALTFLGGSLAGLVSANVLLGLGQLVIVVSSQSLVAGVTPAGRLDGAFGTYAFTVSLGQVLGPFVAGLIGGADATPRTREVFIAGTIAAVVLVAATLPLRSTHRPRGEKLRDLGTFGGVRVVWNTPAVRWPILASIAVTASSELVVVYLPVFGSERAIPAIVIGALLAAHGLAATAARLSTGRLVAWLGRHRLLVASMLQAGIGIGLLITENLALMVVGLVLAGAGLGIGPPLTMAWLANAVAAEVRALGMSVRVTGNRLGQVIIPAGVGSLAGGSGAAGVFSAISFFLLASGSVGAWAGRGRAGKAGGADAGDDEGEG